MTCNYYVKVDVQNVAIIKFKRRMLMHEQTAAACVWQLSTHA
jgi:hypothetical protein